MTITIAMYTFGDQNDYLCISQSIRLLSIEKH